MKKHICKKTKYNKGMALAGTLIMLTIVLMLSALMMSFTLFSANTASLSKSLMTQRALLDELGYAFNSNPDSFSKEEFINSRVQNGTAIDDGGLRDEYQKLLKDYTIETTEGKHTDEGYIVELTVKYKPALKASKNVLKVTSLRAEVEGDFVITGWKYDN